MAIDKNPDLNRSALPPTVLDKAAINAPNSASQATVQFSQKQFNQQALQIGAFLSLLKSYQKECESQLIEHLEAGFLQAELEQSAALQRAELKHQASRLGEVLDPQRFLLAKDQASDAAKPAAPSDETLANGEVVGAALNPASAVTAKVQSHASSNIAPIKR
jgi:hypothetical protein